MKRCYAPDQESIVQQGEFHAAFHMCCCRSDFHAVLRHYSGLDLPELIKDFEACMALASAEKPLMIFLDSLDQLSVEAGAREVRLMSLFLSPHLNLF